jgi:flagellar hook assembly protein FlgD
LRKSLVAIALVLVASLGVVVPSVAAAVGDPKVVIIVGATHAVTPTYRADADVAYAEARKYTSNVVKVYSPNATWAKVKAAAVGASVLIYLGHGNGWPSPYTYDPNYTTKDGFGLNATAGDGDYNNKYYGEPSIATLDLAPGALVILNHLCYASGNSEPGNAEPSVSVARQRADNYAAGFLKAGAAAVIAEGHAGSESTLHALFTTHQSIEDMWRNMPNENGNIVSFPSVRTPGATVYQDPNTPTTGFYRSLTIGELGVTTDEVLSAGFSDTGLDPASLVVPGNASVSTTGTGQLFSGSDVTADTSTTLPAGTRLRVVEEPGESTLSGTPLVEVEGLDDPSITGYMAATDLAPRDSAAPIVRVLDPGPPFSPNGDGRSDQATLRGRFTESVAWTLDVRDDASHVLFHTTGTGSTFSVPWDGLVSGHAVPDGVYHVTVTGVDAWDNAPATTTRDVTVDTVAPALASLTPTADTTQWFSPNGDGFRDTVSLTARNSETGPFVARVLDGSGATVKVWTVVANGSTTAAITWDGRNTAGAHVPDGVYTIRVAAQDMAGNIGTGVDRSVTVVSALRSVTTSKAMFFPQDGDALAATTRLSFTLARQMTVTWTIRDATGAIVRTRLAGVVEPAGTYAWGFDGKGQDGTMLPRGWYTSFVTVTDGTLTATQTIPVFMDAFTVKANDVTPARGQSITVTVVSAEALSAAPQLRISQPGVTPWTVHMVKTSTNHYKITVRLRNAGHTGSVSIRIWGRDVKGGTQSTTKIYPLH